MKRQLSLVILGSLSPLIGLAQEVSPPPTPPDVPAAVAPSVPPVPQVPPVPLVPPVPPVPPDPQHMPPVPLRSGVFLGVEVTRVPSVLSEQLNLPEGFGVLVDYVVPASAADAAGVKTHDILKLLNDQIITSAEQLAVLVRSFREGQEVVLVVIRKGQETRLTATLHQRAARVEDRDEERRSRRQRQDRGDSRDNEFSFNFDNFSNSDFQEQLRKELARSRAQIETQTARALEQARRELREAQERTARAAGSRWNLDRSRVVLRDASGRIELHVAHGKRSLKARDEQGKVVFDGPIDTPEQRKAIPADILPQVEALEKERDAVFPKADDQNTDEDRDQDDASR